MALSKTLREANIRTKYSSNAGAEKVVVNFHTWQEANNFVETDLNRVNPQWIGIIPNRSIFIGGIIHRIPEPFTEEDIWRSLDERYRSRIDKIEILRRRAEPEGGEDLEGEFISTGSVKLFSKTKLPHAVRIFDTSRVVEKIIPRIKRCYRCQRFGHIFQNCSHSVRCNRCGEGHSVQNCENDVNCINCGEAHYASDRECIYFKFNVEVFEIRAAMGISFKEAEAIILETYEDKHQVLLQTRVRSFSPRQI